jgi:predicted transposase YbfD/YdcC
LQLPNGIPSHDTFGRVFSLIAPSHFQQCFINWVESVTDILKGQVVAIDGKTLRRSHDKKSEKSAIHMVSAWAAKNRTVLGQVKTEEKSNEITAIPELLEVLDISGCIVTIDAMGCQKKIAGKIIEKDADYILALKGNQGNLAKEVEAFFTEADKNSYNGMSVDFYETKDVNHGRIEYRRYWLTDAIDGIAGTESWPGLKTVGMVESERHVDDDVSIEYRYYISSIENDAKKFGDGVRAHWGIENSLHWVLDIAFREDESRVRTGNAPENLATARHIALNLLKNEKTAKIGVKNKRLKAGWDNSYLAKLLIGNCF